MNMNNDMNGTEVLLSSSTSNSSESSYKHKSHHLFPLQISLINKHSHRLPKALFPSSSSTLSTLSKPSHCIPFALYPHKLRKHYIQPCKPTTVIWSKKSNLTK